MVYSNQKHGSENFESVPTCPVCTSPDITPYKKRSFDIQKISQEQIKITDSAYGRTWDLSRCQDCTHVFANPAPSPSFMEALYSRVEDPLYEEEAHGRAKNFKRILSRLEKIHPDKGRLFDVGAATGILVRLAGNRGWTAEGIEPSAWAVEYALKKHGLEIRQGSFETATLPRDSFAAVTMVDFIEHTGRPLEAVQKASAVLEPGGILCLVTPDIRSLAARMAGRKWWHFRPGHLGYFTEKSLHRLLTRGGFTVVEKKKYSWTFSAHYLISRKKWLHFLIKNFRLALFLRNISIKLALSDSMEIYAKKKSGQTSMPS